MIYSNPVITSEKTSPITGPIMAKIAEKYADKVIVTEDNNRFEDIDNIFNDIKKGFNNANQHIFISSRRDAIGYVIEKSKVGDIQDELTDIFIYMCSIANRYNICLERAFLAKEEKNKRRTWS